MLVLCKKLAKVMQRHVNSSESFSILVLIPNPQLSNSPQLSTTKSDCKLCAPIPCGIETDKIPTVMVFPMKKEKKVSRVEEETVCVVQWRGDGDQRRWLFTKRPEKGERVSGCMGHV